MYDGLYVDICPPRLQGAELPVGTPAVALRPTTPPGTDRPPAWLDDPRGRPLVYVTLGTIFNGLVRFRLVLDAVDGLVCDVVLTIGRGHDPAALAPVPGNTLVHRYVPQALLLPHVQAVVHHGGSGSMLAALGHGIPQLMLPAGADQFSNADACRAAGLARVLLPDEPGAATLRHELQLLLADDSSRTRCQELAADIARMPEPTAVATAVTAWASPARNRGVA